MKRKIFGIIIIIFGLGLLVAGGYYVYLEYFASSGANFSMPDPFMEKKQDPENDNTPDQSGQKLPDSGKQSVIEAESGDEGGGSRENRDADVAASGSEKDRMLTMASLFTERFGSYSNQSDFGNITDLKMYMTNGMKEWADDFVMENRGSTEENAAYYGIITHVISKELIEMDDDDGSAVIMVDTRRQEMEGSGDGGDSFNQKLRIDLLRENGRWKIDNVSWQ